MQLVLSKTEAALKLISDFCSLKVSSKTLGKKLEFVKGKLNGIINV